MSTQIEPLLTISDLDAMPLPTPRPAPVTRATFRFKLSMMAEVTFDKMDYGR